MIEALFEYQFMQNALISAILASIACGIIGPVIMEKKLVMMSGGIAHTAFGGIGLGYFLGIEPIIGALFFSVLAAVAIALIHKNTRTSSDLLIGMFWSLGMALGILFIAFTPGYPPDMTSYLFGDILTVSQLDIILIGCLDLIIVFVFFAFFNLFKAYLFDEEFSAVIGIPIVILEYTLYILIALSVVSLIRVAGIILIIALLTVPPSIAKLFTYQFKSIILISIAVGTLFSILGIWISYYMDIPSGAAIVVLAVGSYVITSIIRGIVRKYWAIIN
ncbi:MAG: metal ABC transporter permease [Syntrophomonadaceae bacterium]|jgi:zinc transport system permease protein